MRQEWDAGQLYRLHSSYLRDRTEDYLVDPSHQEKPQPFRFRTYPGAYRVDLPGRDFRLPVTLGTVLRERRSIRELWLRPLDLMRVGRLLHASYGVYETNQRSEGRIYARPCPSAGALYPLELYLATQAVTGLPDGIYHYDARAHQLERRYTGLVHNQLAKLVIGDDAPDIIRRANLAIVICSVFERSTWKYGERGYRYVWLEAGHLGQNLYLIATALGLGPVSIDGFFDDELNSLLALPVSEEDALYLLCVGQRLKRRHAR